MLTFQKCIVILLGSLLIACGIDFYLVPFKVLDGGVIGLALIINYLFKIKVGILITALSLPIIVLAWFRYREMFYSSLCGLLVSCIFIDVLEPMQYYFLYYVELSSFTSSVLGGAAVGTGIGLMLRNGASTGGTDLLAQLMSVRSYINVGVIIFILDAVIISMGGLLISMETFYLSILTVTAGGLATSVCTMR